MMVAVVADVKKEEVVVLVVEKYCFFFLLILMAKSTPGGPGAFFTRSPAVSFLPLSRSLSKYSTIGFSASKVNIYSKTKFEWICLLKISLFIGSNFCLKLALLIPSLVT